MKLALEMSGLNQNATCPTRRFNDMWHENGDKWNDGNSGNDKKDDDDDGC